MVEPMCLPTMTQAGCKHMTQCVGLVDADALRIAPQRQTLFNPLCMSTSNVKGQWEVMN